MISNVHLQLLQYGVKLLVLTSFKDTCYIEILPHVERSTRGTLAILWTSFYFVTMQFSCGVFIFKNAGRVWRFCKQENEKYSRSRKEKNKAEKKLIQVNRNRWLVCLGVFGGWVFSLDCEAISVSWYVFFPWFWNSELVIYQLDFIGGYHALVRATKNWFLHWIMGNNMAFLLKCCSQW